MPAQWADAHHLIHWADGGPSDLSNAALLCERHHTVVHTRRYAGRLVEDEGGSRVEWDRRVGSYDELLAGLAARRTSVTPPRTPPHADGVTVMGVPRSGPHRTAMAFTRPGRRALDVHRAERRGATALGRIAGPSTFTGLSGVVPPLWAGSQGLDSSPG